MPDLGQSETSDRRPLPLETVRPLAERIVARYWYDLAGMDSREAARKIVDALIALEKS